METRTSTPSVNGPVASRRRTWRAVSYGLLLAAALFAAWQAHEFWLSVEPPSAPSPPRAASTRPSTSRPRARPRPAARAFSRPAPATQSQPATPFEDLLEESAVQALGEDPVGVAPPPGAVGRTAHALPDGSVAARYDWAGTVEEAARHYEQTLSAEGCKPLGASRDEGGWQYRTFGGAGRRLVVALRQDPQEAKMVHIEVTVIRTK